MFEINRRGGAFSCFSNLLSIWIPSFVRHVGDRAFESCNSLVTVEIPEQSETSFGQWTCFDCPLLANLSIPTSVHQDEVVENCALSMKYTGKGMYPRTSDLGLKNILSTKHATSHRSVDLTFRRRLH